MRLKTQTMKLVIPVTQCNLLVTLLVIHSSHEEVVWYADSGATRYSFNNEDVLVNKVFAKPRMIHLAVEGKVIVLCVPGLRANFLFVSSIEKASFDAIFSNSKMLVKRDNTTHVEVVPVGNLYKIFFCRREKPANFSVVHLY